MLVSHDRYLIDALGSQIWENPAGRPMLQVFEGDYTRYREYQLREIEHTTKVGLTHETNERKPRPIPASSDEKKRRARLREVEEELLFWKRRSPF